MNYEQTKISYYLTFLIGFMIGCGILLIANAQEPTITIPTGNNQSNSRSGGIERTEQDTGYKDQGSGETIKLIQQPKAEEHRADNVNKEKPKRQIQPLLRTGEKKVLVKGFAINSRANYVSTKAWEYRQETGFLILLRCENAEYDMYRRSDGIGDNGFYDYGICQINKGYHPEIVNTDMFWNSLDYQIEQCYKLWKGGTPFYGTDRKSKKNGKPCKENVKNDFTIID